MDLLTGQGPSKRHEIWYFAEARLGVLRIDDFRFRFIDQPEGWPGPKVAINMPFIRAPPVSTRHGVPTWVGGWGRSILGQGYTAPTRAREGD